MVKQEEKWDGNDLKSAQLNAKAMHTFFCTLGASEYNRVSFCENAKYGINFKSLIKEQIECRKLKLECSLMNMIYSQ